MLAALAVGLAVGAGPLDAATVRPSPCRPQDIGSGVVSAVLDGDTLILDGRTEVRLAAATAPKVDPSPEGGLAVAAQAALAAVVLGEAVVLRAEQKRRDRYGRTVAHVFRARDGLWVEQEMARQGWVRVMTGTDEGPCARPLLEPERAAREAKLGLWRDADFAMKSAHDPLLLESLDRFVLVEGKVHSVRRLAKLTYINFGLDHKRSLTATLSLADEKLFISYGKDPMSLVGQRVEMRGWIIDRGGPTMALSHPDEVVVIGR